MLHLRNTPDNDSQVFAVEIIFGRQFGDSFLFLNRLEQFSNPEARFMWRKAYKLKEEGNRTQFARRELQSFYVGSRCLVKIRAVLIRRNKIEA